MAECDLFTVYMHVTPNNKKYIGITSRSLAQRWRRNGEGYKNCSLFWKAINKYGWENIEHKIIFEELSSFDAKKMEILLIRIYRTQDSRYGYNLTAGGDGSLGHIRSAETRAKDSAARMGNKYHLGHKATDEARAKMSAARKGKIFPSDETRAKIGAKSVGNKHALGYKHTDEAKMKISERHKGNKHSLGRFPSADTREKMSAAHSRPVIQYSKDGTEIARFSSVKEAALSINADASNVASCCRGRQKTSHEYMWRYAQNNKQGG